MHIQIFIPVEASIFLKGIQQSNLIIEMMEKPHDRGLYHLETSPLICSANQRTGFYMIGTSVMKE